MLPDHDFLTCEVANPVQLIKRNDFFVRCDLKDRISGRIDDRVSRSKMFITPFIDDDRTGSRYVSQNPFASGFIKEPLDDRGWKPVGIKRERSFGNESSNFPMSRGAVLALGALGHLSETPLNRVPWIKSLDWSDAAKAQSFKMGKTKTAKHPRDVPDGVGSLVAIERRIRELADADAIEHHEYDLTTDQLPLSGNTGKDAERYA
jgi:hypothetical protein